MKPTSISPDTDETTAELLRAHGLAKSFVLARSPFGRPTARTRAVDGVDIAVAAGRTVGVVGESGSGKSTLGRMLARLERPDAGRIEFDGRDITESRGAELKTIRRSLQVIFQDPYGSLDPTKTVGHAITEPLVVHRLAARGELPDRAAELLRSVALDPGLADRHPHQLSGGQRQRIAIARAMALVPKLIVADEPTSALDLSTRSEILNLLLSLREIHGLATVLISHDFATVRHVAHRIVVMYRGRVVEDSAAEDLVREPLHPYTQALLSAVKIPDPRRRRPYTKLARPESHATDSLGCPFAARCPVAMAVCEERNPALAEVGPGRMVACLREHDQSLEPA